MMVEGQRPEYGFLVMYYNPLLSLRSPRYLPVGIYHIPSSGYLSLCGRRIQSLKQGHGTRLQVASQTREILSSVKASATSNMLVPHAQYSYSISQQPQMCLKTMVIAEAAILIISISRGAATACFRSHRKQSVAANLRTKPQRKSGW